MGDRVPECGIVLLVVRDSVDGTVYARSVVLGMDVIQERAVGSAVLAEGDTVPVGLEGRTMRPCAIKSMWWWWYLKCACW